MATLKLRAIGNSVGVVLPKELLAELQVGEGDTLFAVRTPDGLRLTKSDPEFEQDMETARRLMKRWHSVLRELAK
jgi:putative addiction module antidote